MGQKLLILFLVVVNYAHSQHFSLENLQTNEQIEVALDSAYQWMEYTKIKEFNENYLVIENAIELTKNEAYIARFNAYKATFYCYLYDNDKFEYFLNDALRYYQKNNDSKMLIYLFNLKSIYALYLNSDHRESIRWNEKSLELIRTGDKSLEEMSVDVYFNLTVSYSILEEWDASFETSVKCIELAKKYSKSRLPRMYYRKGLAQLYTNDIKEAISSFKLAENLVKEKEISTGKKLYYKNALYLFGLSEAYRLLGENELSADYIREYNTRVKESVDLFTKSIGERTQKNSELLVNLAKRKEEKAEEELRKSEIFYNTVLIGFATLIIGGLLVFISQQRKYQKLNIKKNSLLTSKNEELVSVKEEVETALKVKTDFLNSITHELRTPLYAINSITHMIKDSDELKVDASQIDILSFSGDHLLRFINDVIDFNLGADNYELQRLNLESIDLQNLLDKIKKTIKFSLVLDNENNFNFDFDPTISQNLKIDSLKLSRIIINLLNNASKYTQQGEILFTVKQLDSNAETSTIAFSVKDTGKGISQTQLNEIKVAFKNNLDLVKRIDNTASGLGMGLVMVNRLLKLYNSELIIESKEGTGTTMAFQITFDVDTNSNDIANTETIAFVESANHILIVDDNKINQLVTSKIIKKLGHSCDIAKGGEEAIKMVKENTAYDFILMDIMMPGMDGFQASRIIKEIKPSQKIIGLTAISLRENKQKFIDAGFEDVIEKPFLLEKIKSIIS